MVFNKTALNTAKTEVAIFRQKGTVSDTDLGLKLSGKKQQTFFFFLKYWDLH